jgi:hypothetical protein
MGAERVGRMGCLSTSALVYLFNTSKHSIRRATKLHDTFVDPGGVGAGSSRTGGKLRGACDRLNQCGVHQVDGTPTRTSLEGGGSSSQESAVRCPAT